MISIMAGWLLLMFAFLGLAGVNADRERAAEELKAKADKKADKKRT